MKKHSTIRQTLVDAIKSNTTLIVPGAHDPISAKLIERHRFPAVYVGSYATSAARLGLPDVGLVSMNEMVDHARSIVDAVNVPVIADGENGWFNAASKALELQQFISKTTNSASTLRSDLGSPRWTNRLARSGQRLRLDRIQTFSL